MNQDLSLWLMGCPRLEYCGVPVSIPLTGSQAVLYYLAHSSKPVSRQQLAGLLWTNRSEKDARRQLSYSIYRLGKALDVIGFGELISSDPSDNLGLNPSLAAHLFVDSQQFSELAVKILNNSSDKTTFRRFEDLFTTCQGEFLAGFSVPNSELFETWCQKERSHLQTIGCEAGLRLCESYLENNLSNKALQIAQSVLLIDPLHESAYRLLMRIHNAAGQPGCRPSAVRHTAAYIEQRTGRYPLKGKSGIVQRYS